MKSLAGHLLIAIPELADPNFFRSVVFLFQHDEVGASGVILNRPSSISVAEVWEEVSDLPCDCQQMVNVGGPVEGPLISLHTSLVHGETQVIPGIFLSVDRDDLNAIVTQDMQQFQIYSGYSGWGTEQLENEIEVGGWLIMPADPEHVFASPDELWKQVCETFGQQILPANVSKHLPPDPSMN